MKNQAASAPSSATTETGLIDLPASPLSLPNADDVYRAGEDVVITLKDGRRAEGALLDFRPDRASLSVRFDSDTSADPQEMSLDRIRTAHVPRKRKLVPLGSTLDARGKVMMPPSPQEFEVVLDSGEKLAGDTFGFRTDRNGLHLYPADGSDAYTHLFVSSHAIKSQRIGPLLGEALVAENLLTDDAIQAELAVQRTLRTLPIGEYLTSSDLVTAEQLEAALARQRSMPKARVGEILAREGVITKAQLDEVLRQQEKNRKVPLGEMLVFSGRVSVEALTLTLAKKLGVPFVDLHEFAVDAEAVERVPEDIAREHQALALYVQDQRMVFAIENPMQWPVLEALRNCVHMEVEAVMATAADIAWALDEYYGKPSDEDS